MSISLTINGQSFQYPEPGDSNWGTQATAWASAVTSGMLQKAGGTFTLLAEVDFGATFGLKSVYYKTKGTNIAAAGAFRLARNETISWRNEANSADLALSVNSSNQLLFDGVALGNFVSVADTDSIDLTLTAGVLEADLKLSSAAATAGFFKATASIESDGLLVQAEEASGSQTGFLTSADWTTFNSKQAAGNYITALTGDVVATGPGSVAAAIQNGVITNAMINASAAIAFSKLASLTSGNILVGSAGNVATSVALSGDATLVASGALTIANNAVSNAKLAQMASLRIKGNNTGGASDPLDLTATQVTAMLNDFVGDSGSGGTKGLVPAPVTGDATKFLRGDGVFATPTGSGDVVGPASAVDDNIVTFDGTTGKLIQDSGIPITRLNQATTSALGTVTGGTLPGDTSGNAIAAGYIGEIFSSVVTNVGGINTGGYSTVTSITVTAGVWDLNCVVFIPSTASLTGIYYGVATATNSNTGHVLGDTATGGGTISGQDTGGALAGIRKIVTSSTTYYLTVRPFGTNITAGFNARLSAVRVG